MGTQSSGCTTLVTPALLCDVETRLTPSIQRRRVVRHGAPPTLFTHCDRRTARHTAMTALTDSPYAHSLYTSASYQLVHHCIPPPSFINAPALPPYTAAVQLIGPRNPLAPATVASLCLSSRSPRPIHSFIRRLPPPTHCCSLARPTVSFSLVVAASARCCPQ